MKIAVFSDIHGNVSALDACLSDIERRRPDAVYCLGDLVGYAPYPNEVIARIQGGNIPTIMGNYDDGTGFDKDECGCAYRELKDRLLGDRSFAWTKANVTGEGKAFLRSLESQIRFEADGRRFLLVHGSPRRINEYLFEDRPLSSLERLAATSDADVIVFGHTHKPYTKEAGGVLFVNVGSVGKPKDGDPRACYAVIDSETKSVEFVRLAYDIAGVAAAIRGSGLPPEFADALELAH